MKRGRRGSEGNDTLLSRGMPKQESFDGGEVEGADSLEEVLSTDLGIHIYRNFLESKYVEEHLDALVTVRELKTKTKDEQETLMKEIYTQYVKAGSPNELNNTHPLLMDSEPNFSLSAITKYGEQIFALLNDEFYQEFKNSEFEKRLKRLLERKVMKRDLPRTESYNSKVSKEQLRSLEKISSSSLPDTAVAAFVLRDLNYVLMDPTDYGKNALRAYLSSFGAAKFLDLYYNTLEYLSEESNLEKSNILNNVFNKYLKKSAPKQVYLPFEVIHLSAAEDEENKEFFIKIKNYCYKVLSETYFEGFVASKGGRNMAKNITEMEHKPDPRSKVLKSFDEVRRDKDGLLYLKKYLTSHNSSQNLEFVTSIEEKYRMAMPEEKKTLKFEIQKDFIMNNSIGVSKKCIETISVDIEDEEKQDTLFDDAYNEIYQFLSEKVFRFFSSSVQGKELEAVMTKRKKSGKGNLGLNWDIKDISEGTAGIDGKLLDIVPVTDGDVRKQITDVEQILEAGDEKAVDLLRSYMVSQHKAESLEFYMDIRHYQDASNKDREHMKYVLFRKYVQAGAEKEINVGSAIKNTIMFDISTKAEGLYDEALNAITHLIQRDTFANFIVTNLGKQAATLVVKARKKGLAAKKKTISGSRVIYILRNIRNILVVEEGMKAFKAFLDIIGGTIFLDYILDISKLVENKERDVDVKMGLLSKYVKTNSSSGLRFYSFLLEASTSGSLDTILLETMRKTIAYLNKKIFGIFCNSEPGKALAYEWPFFKNDKHMSLQRMFARMDDGQVLLTPEEESGPKYVLKNLDKVLQIHNGQKLLALYLETKEKQDYVEIYADVRKYLLEYQEKSISVAEKELSKSHLEKKYFADGSKFSHAIPKSVSADEQYAMEELYKLSKKELMAEWNGFLESREGLRLARRVKRSNTWKMMNLIADVPTYYRIELLPPSEISLKRIFNVCMYCIMDSLDEKKMRDLTIRITKQPKNSIADMTKFDMLLQLCRADFSWKSADKFSSITGALSSKLKRQDLASVLQYYSKCYNRALQANEIEEQEEEEADEYEELKIAVSDYDKQDLRQKYKEMMKKLKGSLDTNAKAALISMFTGSSLPRSSKLTKEFISEMEEHGLSFCNQKAIRDLYFHMIVHLKLTTESLLVGSYLQDLLEAINSDDSSSASGTVSPLPADLEQNMNELKLDTLAPIQKSASVGSPRTVLEATPFEKGQREKKMQAKSQKESPLPENKATPPVEANEEPPKKEAVKASPKIHIIDSNETKSSPKLSNKDDPTSPGMLMLEIPKAAGTPEKGKERRRSASKSPQSVRKYS